jgi:uncharacterized protein YPO0396
MFDLFKRLRHLENALCVLDLENAQRKVEIESLREALDDARTERNEFKDLLFKNVGLKREQGLSISESTPVIHRRTGINRVITDLEARSREKYWVEKEKKADEILNSESTDVK